MLKNKYGVGWKPSVTFEEGLERTVTWYLENQTWLNNIHLVNMLLITKQYLYRRFHGLDTDFTVMSKLVFEDETYKIRGAYVGA
jgi:hypothetical protein